MRTIRGRGALLATAAITIVVAGFGAIYTVHAHQPPGSSGAPRSSRASSSSTASGATGTPGSFGAIGSLGSADSGPYPGLHGQITPECPGKSLTTVGGPGILPHNGCTPSFTAQDVRAYLAHSTGLGKIEAKGRMVVTRVIFLTIRDLDRLTNDTEWEANFPGNLLVCYVGLSGTFTVAGPPGASHPAATSTASIVFDAHTGNGLVMSNGDVLAGRL